jgi:hypothetical protein
MTDSLDAPSSAAGPAPAAKLSFLQRVVGVFFSPSETFRDIAAHPSILAPIILLILTWIPASVIMATKVDFGAPARAQMEAKGGMSKEDVERVARISGAVGKAMSYFSPLFSVVILAIVAGIFLLAFRLFGGDGTYRQAVSITAWSWLPMSVGSILAAVVLATRKSIEPQDLATLLRSNLAFLVDFEKQPVLFGFVSSFDIFTIWMLALLAIGFSWMSRFTKAKSFVLVFGLWFTWIALKTSGAALFSSMGKR